MTHTSVVMQVNHPWQEGVGPAVLVHLHGIVRTQCLSDVEDGARANFDYAVLNERG